jgi:hypothetical protein
MTTVKDLIEALMKYPLDATVTVSGAFLDEGELLFDSYDPVVKSWEPADSVVVLPDSPIYHERFNDDLADWHQLQLYQKERQKVSATIRFWDRDQHDLDCDCGSCSSVNHVSWAYAVFLNDDDEPYETFYAPTEDAAIAKADRFCRMNLFTIKEA